MALNKKQPKQYRRGIYWLINLFTGFIYSVFAHGDAMDRFFSESDSFENSYCCQALDRTARSFQKGKFANTAELLIENSRPLQIISVIRSFLSRLSLSVYGLFLCAFGLSSISVYYTVILLGHEARHGLSAVITSAVMVVCSIPMLMSQRSTSGYISESQILRNIAISILGIPEEKIKSGKRIGGTGFMFTFAALGICFGALTYFWHPTYMPVVALAVIAVCIISANPETGVLITVAAVPFLQYSDIADFILVVLILITSISYLSKLLRHRRTITYTAESVIVIIFCGFILAASLFASGGIRTLITTLFAIIIIIGGFFTTYNLMRGEALLDSVKRILGISFSALAVVGVWNVFYDAVVDGVFYPIRDYVQPILEGNNIYIADSVEVFGVFAIIAFPLVVSSLAKKKTVSGVILQMVLLVILVSAAFIYGTYEIVFALIIEFGLFWILYSHKTLNAAFIILMPLCMLTIIFPYLVQHFNIINPMEEFRELLPLGLPEAPGISGVVESTVAMIRDGNYTGIGVGRYAYVSAMNGYTDAVSAGAGSPGNFYLQIICWSGMGGLITFAIFIVLMFKKSAGYLASGKDKNIRASALALFCGLATLLVFGSVNCIWDDMRMLYLFFAAAGLLAGYVREGKDRERRQAAYLYSENDCTDVDLRTYN